MACSVSFSWMLAIVVVLASLTTTVSAWSTGSAVSSFGGNVLISAPRPVKESCGSAASNMITMKKGKANVPPQMRSQYKAQQEMQSQREQMVAASQPGADGLPVFNLFVQTQKKNLWYPCGTFKGDDRSAALAKNYANGGLLAGISKKQIDGGIAGSLFRDQNKLKESIVRAYPQLRPKMDEFEFGYKLGFEGLSEEQSNEIKVIQPKETKGLLDNVKNIFT